MRRISSDLIVDNVADLAVGINLALPVGVRRLLENAARRERRGHGREYLDLILTNLTVAGKECLPLCQDTGLVSAFVEMGADVRLTGRYATVEDAINEGVRIGYRKGSLRMSVVGPLDRKNTGTNTPSVVYFFPVKGDVLNITLMAKGFGSENACAIKMLKPSDGKAGIEAFVVETMRKAGPNPCPPVFIGVGVGGSFDKAAVLSKLALCEAGEEARPMAGRAWEQRILKLVNRLDIGPGGFGGGCTALDVRVKTFPTHIAGLPVAVSVACWAHRVGKIKL